MSDKKLEELRDAMERAEREYDDARYESDCARSEERGREEKWARARDDFEAYEDKLREEDQCPQCGKDGIGGERCEACKIIDEEEKP